MQDPLKKPTEKAQVQNRAGGWTEEEVRRLTRLWPNHTNAQIAARLGRGENAVAIKASRLCLPPKNIARLPVPDGVTSKARMRPCLTCSKDFFSEGSGNRICNACKSSRSWTSGADYVIGMR